MSKEILHGFTCEFVHEGDTCKLVDVLVDENAKLREMVKTLAHCAAGHGCDLCPLNGGCGRVGEFDMCESVQDRMRELGVEQ